MLATLALVALAHGCSDPPRRPQPSSIPPTEPSVATPVTLGPAGGTVALPNGGTIIVPPQTLTATTEIAVEVAKTTVLPDASWPAQPAGDGVRVSFSEPLTK